MTGTQITRERTGFDTFQTWRALGGLEGGREGGGDRDRVGLWPRDSDHRCDIVVILRVLGPGRLRVGAPPPPSGSAGLTVTPPGHGVSGRDHDVGVGDPRRRAAAARLRTT